MPTNQKIDIAAYQTPSCQWPVSSEPLPFHVVPRLLEGMSMDASHWDSKMNIKGQQHVGVAICLEIGCDVYMLLKGMSVGPMKAQLQRMGNGNGEIPPSFRPSPT